MPFPTTPVDGQVYVTPDGMRYLYASISKSWKLNSGAAVSKDNMQAITAPTQTDDITSGYGVGSSWMDTVSGTFYDCVDSTANLAVWRISGIRPAHFAGNIPLLTTVPTISTVVPFATVSTNDITNSGGSITISTGGIYNISFTAYVYGSSIHKTYQAQYFEGNIPDVIIGSTIVNSNVISTKFNQTYAFAKIKTLVPGSIITIRHMTDDLAMTAGCDISIIRVG